MTKSSPLGICYADVTYKQGKISLQCKRILDSEGELLINIRNGMAAIFFYFKEKKEKESKNRK